MHDRRERCPGGTWFFTVNLYDHGADDLVRHVDCLRAAFRRVRHDHPFAIAAMVVLPDHLHAVWRLPADDADYPTRWRLIKAAFTRAVRAERAGTRGHGSRIWQQGCWEQRIRDRHELARHVAYIHFDPVHHGHAGRPIDWPYSSIHRHVRAGRIAADWDGDGRPATGSFGEREAAATA